MRFIDLTQSLTEDMPLFPGTPAPKFSLKYQVETDGFREQEITFYSHTGTHLDTPAHVFDQGKTLDDFGVDQFCGQGLVLDFSNIQDEIITIDSFEKALEKSLSKLEDLRDNLWEKVDYLFFYTGWDEKWGKESYFEDAPGLSKEVANRVTELNLKGVGIDALSIDSIKGDMLLAHRILLGKELIIVENLKNLQELLHRDFEFYGFPLKIQDGEGSPIRGIAKIL